MQRTIQVLPLLLLFLLAAPIAHAETRATEFPATLRLSSANNVVASPSAPVAFIGSRDTDTVFAFDPRTGVGIGQLEVADGPLAVELFEGGGRRLLGVTCDGFLGAAANGISLVDATDPAHMRLLRTIELPESRIFFLGAQTLRFVAGGTVAVVTAADGATARAVLLAYDVETGAELSRADVGFVPGSIDVVTAEGRTIAAITQSVAPRGRVTIVDLTDPSAMRVERVVKLPKKSGLYNVNNVALSADGRYGFVAAGDDNVVFSFEVETGRTLSRTITGPFPTTVRRFSIDGAPRLLVNSEDGAAIFVYDVSDPASPVPTVNYKSSAAFFDVEPVISADGRTVFATSTGDNKVYAIDLVTGSLKYQTPTGERPVTSAVWESDGGRYVLAGATIAANVTAFKDGQGPSNFRSFTGSAGGVLFTLYQNVALSRDGRFAFTASRVTNELLAFDVATGALVGRTGVTVAPSQIAVGEDASGNRRIAVIGSADGTVSIVDATDPSAMTTTGLVDVDSPYPFFLQYANVVATADGTTAFVVDGNQFVYAIDLASGTIVGSVNAGFLPITLALREDRGQRRLAVLNAIGGSSSLTVLDVTDPVTMTRVASAEFAPDLVVALNNVPKFTPDGRFVVVGASLSERVLVIDATTGRIAGSAAKTSAVVPAPYLDNGVAKFAAVNLGPDASKIYRLKKTGAPREETSLGELDSSYYLVGNDPIVAADGLAGIVPNFGRASLIAFDPRTGTVTGELPLGKGPGQIAYDESAGTIVALEIDGTASRILFANVADARTPSAAANAVAARPPSTGIGASGAVEAGRVRASEDRSPRVATFSTERKSIVEWNRRSSRK